MTGTTDTKRTTVYEELRPLLFSIAYQMVASASDAEDIVQEAFLRFHRESRRGTDIASPKAWLSTVTTRLAINHVQSARVRRERYVGTWLPEPLVTEPDPAGLRHAETADSLSLAFLVLLESLGPVERAVFLLREVFGYGYDEIAAVVGKSPDNCRQVAVRARRQVEARKPRFEASRRKREALSRRFFEAVEADDAQGLVRLLAADVVLHADGGGKAQAPTIRRPLYGRERVARLFGEIGPFSQRLGARSVRYAEVNGQPGALYLDRDGHPVLVVSLDIADGLVQTVHAITNPDKLRHLTLPTDPD
ncbi:MAG TPA: RNA polymerase sigma-70 factor [Actinomycetes bacterium]|nr:RNA polymerase sigma-70 factor [Actinomycetes bacterium]